MKIGKKHQTFEANEYNSWMKMRII